MTDPDPDNNSCCICGQPDIGYGHNAQPVADGRCCDACNSEWVVTARIIMAVHQSRAMTNPPGSPDSND